MDSENILSITLGSKEYYFLYENNEIWYLPEGKKQNESYKANKSGASAIIEVPPIWIITRKNGAPLFAIKASPNDQEKFNILSAKKLYDSAIQWFEPLADNYRELIWIHPQSSVSSNDRQFPLLGGCNRSNTVCSRYDAVIYKKI